MCFAACLRSSANWATRSAVKRTLGPLSEQRGDYGTGAADDGDGYSGQALVAFAMADRESVASASSAHRRNCLTCFSPYGELAATRVSRAGGAPMRSTLEVAPAHSGSSSPMWTTCRNGCGLSCCAMQTRIHVPDDVNVDRFPLAVGELTHHPLGLGRKFPAAPGEVAQRHSPGPAM
jgi:hypothetical protein